MTIVIIVIMCHVPSIFQWKETPEILQCAKLTCKIWIRWLKSSFFNPGGFEKSVYALPNKTPLEIRQFWRWWWFSWIFRTSQGSFICSFFWREKKFGGKISSKPFLQHQLSRCCTRSWAKLGLWRWSDLTVRHTSPRHRNETKSRDSRDFPNCFKVPMNLRSFQPDFP